MKILLTVLAEVVMKFKSTEILYRGHCQIFINVSEKVSLPSSEPKQLKMTFNLEEGAARS
jgi:hypothetical protein